MPRRDAQAGGVFEGADRGGAKQRPLLLDCALAARSLDDADDLLAAEDADDLIDLGHLLEQHRLSCRSARQPATTTEPTRPCLLQLEHLADDGERFLPGRLDEAAGVDDDDIGPVGVRSQGVAVLGQLAEHALGIDQVLWAAKRYKRKCALAGIAHFRIVSFADRPFPEPFAVIGVTSRLRTRHALFA